MKIMLLLCASALASLALSGEDAPETAVPEFFTMTPEASVQYLNGPLDNVQAAMAQARARLASLDEDQRSATIGAAHAAVETGPYESVTVHVVETLSARLTGHAAHVPTETAERERQLAAVPIGLVDVVTAQDERLASLAAAVESHLALLDALAVTDGCCCCCIVQDDSACDLPPACQAAPACGAPAHGTSSRQPATAAENIEKIATVVARADALQEEQRQALQTSGQRVSEATASLWNSKLALIRYRTGLEDLLAESARIASSMRDVQEPDDEAARTVERRSRMLRDDVMELTRMLNEYIALYGC
ncbi:MAG: hypothetical protein ACYTG2_01075 [Planctomycetota bacterium]|jgi:hypothetical protein